MLKLKIITTVLLPVVLFVALLVWAGAEQHQAELAYKQADKHRKLLQDLALLDEEVTQLGKNFFAARINLPNAIAILKKAQTAEARLDIALEALKADVGKNEEIRATIDRCLASRKAMSQSKRRLAELVFSDHYTDEGYKAISGDLRNNCFQSAGDLISLQKAVTDAVQSDYDHTFKIKSEERWVILSFGIVNVIVAAVTAFTLSQDASSRLERLKSNVQRYKNGDEMLPPKPGTDEIAVVEEVFFETATQVREAQQRQKELVMMFTHDLRNPLSAVNLGLESIEYSGDANSQRSLSKIRNNVDRIHELITDLLDLYKVESNMEAFANESFNLSDTIGSACEHLGPLAEQLQVRLDNQGTNDPVLVYGDPRASLRVIVNLIGNALKYSPANSEITISLDADRDFARVHVTDRGPGIPEEEQKSIFERFYQGSGAKKSRLAGLGSGLGLALSRQFAEKQAGQIAVVSSLGKGSTFTFGLPRGPRSAQ